MADVYVLTQQEGVWAGGIARLPDGYELVYQRDEDFGAGRGQSVARARKVHGSLLAPSSLDLEETIAGTAVARAYDPGVVVFGTGAVVMASFDIGAMRGGVHVASRSGDGRWTDLGVVSVEEAHAEAEATLQRCGAQTLLAYSVQPAKDDRWTIQTRRLTRGAWGPPIAIGSQSGHGPSGDQKRVTIARRDGAYVALWSDGDGTTHRTVRKAVSADAAVWSDEGEVASLSGQDLVNPYVMGDDGADVLAVVVANPGGLYLLHVDGSMTKAILPTGVRNVSRPVVIHEDGVAVCFASFSYNGKTTLGTFALSA